MFKTSFPLLILNASKFSTELNFKVKKFHFSSVRYSFLPSIVAIRTVVLVPLDFYPPPPPPVKYFVKNIFPTV